MINRLFSQLFTLPECVFGKNAYSHYWKSVLVLTVFFMFRNFFCMSKTDKSIGNSFRLADGQERKTIYSTILFVADLRLTNYPFFVFYFLRARGICIFSNLPLNKKKKDIVSQTQLHCLFECNRPH